MTVFILMAKVKNSRRFFNSLGIKKIENLEECGFSNLSSIYFESNSIVYSFKVMIYSDQKNRKSREP